MALLPGVGPGMRNVDAVSELPELVSAFSTHARVAPEKALASSASNINLRVRGLCAAAAQSHRRGCIHRRNFVLLILSLQVLGSLLVQVITQWSLTRPWHPALRWGSRNKGSRFKPNVIYFHLRLSCLDALGYVSQQLGETPQYPWRAVTSKQDKRCHQNAASMQVGNLASISNAFHTALFLAGEPQRGRSPFSFKLRFAACSSRMYGCERENQHTLEKIGIGNSCQDGMRAGIPTPPMYGW